MEDWLHQMRYPKYRTYILIFLIQEEQLSGTGESVCTRRLTG